MKPDSKQMLLRALSEFGHCDVTVDGQSMKPFICSGDVASIVTTRSHPHLGEVVAFFNNDQLIMHRITRCKKRADGSWELVVRGDSSPCSEGTVVSSEIIGVVRSLNRNYRKHSLWFRFPLRLVAVPVGFIARFLVRRTR